jgi:hypothetical protein
VQLPKPRRLSPEQNSVNAVFIARQLAFCHEKVNKLVQVRRRMALCSNVDE